MRVGDLVKRKLGRRTQWVGIIIKDESRLNMTNRGGKTFLVYWFIGASNQLQQAWEQDFSLEVISAVDKTMGEGNNK